MPGLEEEIARARARFLAWVTWYLASYPDRVKGQNDLAKKIGIAVSSMSLLRNPRENRCPSFETLIGFEHFTKISVQTLLHTDPPEILPNAR